MHCDSFNDQALMFSAPTLLLPNYPQQAVHIAVLNRNWKPFERSAV